MECTRQPDQTALRRWRLHILVQALAAPHGPDSKVTPQSLRSKPGLCLYRPPAPLRSSADPRALGNLQGELLAYLKAGIEGFFTDQADLGFAARKAFLEHR